METTANIYREKNYYRVMLNVAATKMLNSDEICFDKKNLVIRIPTIFNTRTYRLYNMDVKNSVFIFSYERDHEPEKDITGKYLLEKDGDDYYFVKK